MNQPVLRPGDHLVALVESLGGTWHGHAALCRCPAHDDRTPSLSLRQGHHAVLVTCFAGCDRRDVLKALARIPLSGRRPPPPPTIAGTSHASGLWERALPVGDDPARRYLALRGLSSIPEDIRYLARCPHGPRPRTLFKPALLVAVREGKALQAVQRIFLEPEHARHKSKAMLGRTARGAWQGQRSGTVLGLAEGFETAAAFSQLTGLPCWASLGAWRLDRIALPADVCEIVVAEDNDSEGARAAARACAYYGSIGLDVRRLPPPRRHSDWADVLEAQAERGGGSSG